MPDLISHVFAFVHARTHTQQCDKRAGRGGNKLSHLENLLHRAQALTGDLADVQQSSDGPQVHKCSIRLERPHHTCHHVACFESLLLSLMAAQHQSPTSLKNEVANTREEVEQRQTVQPVIFCSSKNVRLKCTLSMPCVHATTPRPNPSAPHPLLL